MCVEPVGHELKLAIRWDEGDGAVILKPGQPHTLVELDILQLNRLTLATCSHNNKVMVNFTVIINCDQKFYYFLFKEAKQHGNIYNTSMLSLV